MCSRPVALSEPESPIAAAGSPRHRPRTDNVLHISNPANDYGCAVGPCRPTLQLGWVDLDALQLAGEALSKARIQSEQTPIRTLAHRGAEPSRGFRQGAGRRRMHLDAERSAPAWQRAYAKYAHPQPSAEEAAPRRSAGRGRFSGATTMVW